MTRERVGAVIAAAGKSERMGGRDKTLVPLGGKPVLEWVIVAFHNCAAVDEIVLVVPPANVAGVQTWVSGRGWPKLTTVCAGGARRQDSVAAGLARLQPCDWVIIHDGARPLVTGDLIVRGLESARETGAAIAAVPVTDTIKVAGTDMVVQTTPERGTLWAAQTPQVFRYAIIAAAYRQAGGEATDDASLVERAGYRVKLFPGSPGNIKLTTPEDLVLAEALARQYAS